MLFYKERIDKFYQIYWRKSNTVHYSIL
jgi:hypothetical protein